MERTGSPQINGRHSAVVKIGSTLLIAVAVFALHSYHVSTMFENSRQFSYLSPLEREMSFKSEMGFYYSYYKTIVEAETFDEGYAMIQHDDRVEYPDVVNALKRFNIHPEVIVGYLFHRYRDVCSRFNVENRECYLVERSNGAEDDEIVTCVGSGEPVYFYLAFVWTLAGFTAVLIFLYGFYLSRNVFGGILAVLCYFYNHSEATRVQWTPPLRESFAYPFLLLHMLSTTVLIRRSTYDFKRIIQVLMIGLIGMLCLIFWQFSQFIMMTQLVILTLMRLFEMVAPDIFLLVTFSHNVSIWTAIVLMRGNDMLLTSFYLSFACSVLVISLVFKWYRYRYYRYSYSSVLFVTALLMQNRLKMEFGNGDDSHIFDILLSKLGIVKNFHTMLYTCSAEFDFFPLSSLLNLSATLLLPCVVWTVGAILSYWYRRTNGRSRFFPELMKTVRTEQHIIFNLLLLFVYVILAILIMRLKLFMTPHLCIVAALIAVKKFHWYIPDNYYALPALFVALVAVMSVRGVENVTTERNFVGEFSNEPLEDLLVWIQENTDESASFAGPMPITSAVYLSTRRPIINHPHYENANLRERTVLVYSAFSRQSPLQLYLKLDKLKTTYLILDDMWCYQKSSGGCTMLNIWDVEDPEHKYEPSLCAYLSIEKTPPYFQRVYSNAQFTLLKLHNV